MSFSVSGAWPNRITYCKIFGSERELIAALSGPVLRDTARLSQRYPCIARYGVLGVSAWPIGCDTPSPFSERSAILARYPMKTSQMGAIPPFAILSRKGIARYGGGISHWAAKSMPQNAQQNYKSDRWANQLSNIFRACSSVISSSGLVPARLRHPE